MRSMIDLHTCRRKITASETPRQILVSVIYISLKNTYAYPASVRDFIEYERGRVRLTRRGFAVMNSVLTRLL